jgi:hypothetical protein
VNFPHCWITFLSNVEGVYHASFPHLTPVAERGVYHASFGRC